jgi:hypothetical protein
VVDVVHHDPHHHHRDLDRHHHNRSARRTVVDPEPGRQLPEWLSRLGQLLRAIGRCAHTRDPAREAAQRSMPMGLARVRHSVLAQRALIRSKSQNFWRWEISRAGRSSPVEQSSASFDTMAAATRAGKDALKQFLDKYYA